MDGGAFLLSVFLILTVLGFAGGGYLRSAFAALRQGGGAAAGERCCEMSVFRAAAFLRAAAGVHEQAETVDDVPHRRDGLRRRCTVRLLILPDHRHARDAVDAGGQGAAERGCRFCKGAGLSRTEQMRQRVLNRYLQTCFDLRR